MSLCAHVLQLLAIAAGTGFWMWYLLWEYEHFRNGKPRTRWWERDIWTEKRAGITPVRPNHERGCIYRYGAVSDSGEIRCSCPHKDHPDVEVKI